MTLTAKYQRFLASPSLDVLAEKASLHYIPTATSFNEPTPIVKHLVSQAKQLEKKSEKVLSAIDSGNAICLDIETTVEFKIGGGAILPGLDDNFLADRVATYPVVHIVHFDEAQKITQIRQYWDQGSLLKAIEVIGIRGKNWPITLGKEQISVINSSASFVPQASTENSRPSTSSSQRSFASKPASRKSSSVSATGDPHASLNLFAPREIIEEEDYLPTGNVVSTRQPIKPTSRDLTELIGEGSAQNGKANVLAKAGSSKKWGANRMFEEEEPIAADSPQKTSIKTEAKKWNHFEFGNGEDGDATPQQRPTGKGAMGHNSSSWGFEDFSTPAKVKQKVRAQDTRHFGWSEDETETSPVRRPVVHQPRKNLNPQFEFEDDGTPDGKKTLPTSKGKAANAGMGLYQDHILGDDAEDNTNHGGQDNIPANKGNVANLGMGLYQDHVLGDDAEDNGNHGGKQALSNVTAQYNNAGRKKNLGHDWEINDKSPAAKRTNAQEDPIARKPGKNLDTHWGIYDESPKTNAPRKIYNTAGNGMGGRSDGNHFQIGSEGGAEEMPAMGSRKQGAPAQSQENLPIRASNEAPRKIYNTAGNGMGGRNDSEQYQIGNEGGEEALPTRGRHKQTETNFNWDF